MNLPDITLVIQVIHFLIAYTFLRKFIFTPALRILNKQESDRTVLQASIDQASIDKKNAIVRLHDRWGSMKEALYTLIPSLKVKHFEVAHDTDAQKKMKHLDTDVITEQRAQLKKTIVQSVLKVKS